MNVETFIMQNSGKKTGIWVVGAWGGVAATVAVGLLAMAQRKVKPWGLTTELPQFTDVPMPEWSDFVLGGCEIRQSSYAQATEELVRQNALNASVVASVADDLKELDGNIRPSFLQHSGAVVENMADWMGEVSGTTARDMITAMQADMDCFKDDHDLDHLIVVNLMSTEPFCTYFQWERLGELPTEDLQQRQAQWQHWDAMASLLDLPVEECPLPASTLYAIATLELGYDFLNFTPSLGATPPALHELARSMNARTMGNDGKTGETLMKSVLAPMFAHRNLEVMSWVGHNILGNRDGAALDDPLNKATKLNSKSHLLSQILGYDPEMLVSIEYIKSLGDWKTAWDHIHFRGFLGTPMTLQFTWQGCDSLLAAPLVLDLVRLTQLARMRGFTGKMDFLSCFFKSPVGIEEQNFERQFAMLEAWLKEVPEQQQPARPAK